MIAYGPRRATCASLAIPREGAHIMPKVRSLKYLLAMLCMAPCAWSATPRADFSMAQVLHYPYASQLTAAERADAIAWVSNLGGVRNVWVARGPAFTPLQITHNSEDDGQEITQLTFSPDGSRLVFGGGRGPRRKLAPRGRSLPRSGVFAGAAGNIHLVGAAGRWRRAGETCRGRCTGNLRAGAARLREGRSCVDGAARRRQIGAPVLRPRQGRRASLVAGWKPAGVRVQPRRPRIHRNFFLQRCTAGVFGTGHRQRWLAPLVAGRRSDSVRAPTGRWRSTGARPDAHAASLVDLGGIGRRRTGPGAVAEPENAGGIVSRCGRRVESGLDGRPVDLPGI